MTKAHFDEPDIQFVRSVARKTTNLIANTMDEAFGVEGIKSTMATVSVAALIANYVCNDETPASVAEGVGSFNLILPMVQAPFTLVQTPETDDPTEKAAA